MHRETEKFVQLALLWWSRTEAQYLQGIPVLGNALKKMKQGQEFPGSPVVKTLRFHCRAHGFNPWLGN